MINQMNGSYREVCQDLDQLRFEQERILLQVNEVQKEIGAGQKGGGVVAKIQDQY